MNTLNHLICLASFSGALTLIPAFTVMSELKPNDSELSRVLASVGDSSLFNGSYTKRVEQAFDKSLSIRDFSVSAMAAVQYLIFSEGGDGVVVGKDEWLFSSEEFDQPANADANIEANLATVVAIDEYFKRKGITLVVAPIPAKARLLRGQLNHRWSEARGDLYARMINHLHEGDVHVVDSYAAMKTVASDSLYFRLDTHWTPVGSHLVADATATYCDENTDVNLAQQSYQTEVQKTSSLDGDLMNFIPLSPWFSRWGPEPEVFEQSRTYAQSDDLFSENPINTILVGTSYSADKRWNFSGFLKQALGREVANYSAEGLGPYRPMYNLLNLSDALNDIDLVVWEIPERYLVQSYSEVTFTQLLERNESVEIAVNDTVKIERF
ncbi:MAG: alginate O-acetyltransferase AlgX-related protein [Cellvibrionaceae bacterium]